MGVRGVRGVRGGWRVRGRWGGRLVAIGKKRNKSKTVSLTASLLEMKVEETLDNVKQDLSSGSN